MECLGDRRAIYGTHGLQQCSLNTCRKSRFVRLDTPKILSKVPEKTGRILVSGPPPACRSFDLGFYLRPATSGKEPVGSTFQYSIGS